MVVSAKVSDALAQAQSAAESGNALLSIVNGLETLSSPANLADDLMALGDELFRQPRVSMIMKRMVLDAIIAALKSYENDETWIQVGQHLLGLLQGSNSSSSNIGDGSSSGGSGGGSGSGSGSGGGAGGEGAGGGTGAGTSSTTPQFLDQIAALCDLVATALENEERFGEAAQQLAAIPLDSSQRRVSQEDRVRVWVRIVRDYLEVDDSTAAETYLNKLKGVVFDVADPELQLHFKLSQARINDAKREFLAASTAYHDISYSPAIAEEERLHTLSMAIKCAVLAPAGPTRSRVLGRLYKDDRIAAVRGAGMSSSAGAGAGTGTGTSTGIGGTGGSGGLLAIDPNEFAILEKMYLDRLLTPAEVERFAQSLSPHQLATTADGSTVLAKAVVEHNLLGVSRLYRNIALGSLARLLGLDDARKAEETTARMIEQGRLVGRIDQIAGVVWFEGGEASGVKGSGRTESAVDMELRQWGANVQSVALEVENIANMLQQTYPAFYAQHTTA